MSNPRDRNQVIGAVTATQRALVPALPTPRTGNAAMDSWIGKVNERLELREGNRGNQWERTILLRDMVDLGIVNSAGVSGRRAVLKRSDGGGVMMGNGVPMSVDTFAEHIWDTKLFRDLTDRIDDPRRFEALPRQTRDLLREDIAVIDQRITASIRHTEEMVSDQRGSFTQEVTSLRSSVARAAAGVRQVRFASASQNRAIAGQITQVSARLDDFGGLGATVEETMTATADRVEGFAAEYFVKVVAGNTVTGFGLSASEDPTGASDSAFIVLADSFALVTPSTTITDPLNPPAAHIPFGADASGAYINGTLRINSGGTTLNDLAAATGVIVSATSDFWKVDSTGAAVNTSITLTATLTGSLTGYVTWSKSGAGTAPPTAGTTNTWTINAADQTDDTCTYTATLVDGAVTYTDNVTVVRLRDGTNALTGLLSNESHTVASLSDGTSVNYTGATGTFEVYRGATLLATPDVAFSYVSSTGFSSAPSSSINATTGVYTISANMNADVATVTYRATVGSTTIDKVFTLTKARQGIAGTNGTAGANAQTLALTATGFAFAFDDANATSSASPTVTFVANLQNVSGTATFVATAYNAAGTSLGTITLGGSTNTRTLTAAQFVTYSSTAYVKVVATLSALSDTITIYRMDSGIDAVLGYLTNEAHVVAAATDGTVGSFSGVGGTFKVFDGTTDKTTSGSVTYTVNATSSVTASINSSGVYAVTAMSADTGYATLRAVYAGVTIDKIFTVSKSKTGSTGATGTPGLNGTRGNVNGYGTTYGMRVSIWDSTTDQYANRVVDNVVNGTTTATVLALTTGNKIGDQVTMGNGTPWRETKGAYNSATTYLRGEIALNAGGTTAYRALSTTTGNTVTNTTYWAVLATVNSRGAWAGSTAYAANDTVTGTNLAGTSTTWIANYAHTSQGTFATERDGGGFVETRYWGGSSWLRPGVVVDGNLMVTGTLSSINAELGNVRMTAQGSIMGGKTSFSDTTAGFVIGYDPSDSKYKSIIGDASSNLTWSGTALTLGGSANISITGTAKIDGSTTGSLGTAALQVNNTTLSLTHAQHGVIAGANTSGYAVWGEASGEGGAGVYGHGTFSSSGVKGLTTGPAVFGVDAANTGGGVAVSAVGSGGVASKGLYAYATGTSAIGIDVGASGTGSTALKVTANAASDLAIDIAGGKLKWKTYTWAEPDGTTTKILGANGNWFDATNALKLNVTGVAGSAGASLGYITVDLFSGGTPVKIPVYTV